jgi:hypothetical protein
MRYVTSLIIIQVTNWYIAIYIWNTVVGSISVYWEWFKLQFSLQKVTFHPQSSVFNLYTAYILYIQANLPTKFTDPVMPCGTDRRKTTNEGDLWKTYVLPQIICDGTANEPTGKVSGIRGRRGGGGRLNVLGWKVQPNPVGVIKCWHSRRYYDPWY